MSGNPATDPAFYHGDPPAFGQVAGRPRPAAATGAATPQPEPATEPESRVLADDVAEYHTGGGWYEIPGLDEKVKGKADAQAALDALRAEG